MEMQFNRVVVVIAVLLLFSKGQATVNSEYKDEIKVNHALSEIIKAAKQDSSILPFILLSDKAYVESELNVQLSEQEYRTIRVLVSKLFSHGLNVRFVPVDEMILASQELVGGGHKR